MKQRREFIEAWLRRDRSVAALCRAFGVSRQTGYVFIRRFKELGREGLRDRTSAPKTNPRATSPEAVELVLELRRRWGWGPAKLLVRFKEARPDLTPPAASTIAAILKRKGLARPQKRRSKAPPRSKPFAACEAPNDVWCADFKGDFRVGDGTRCYPLTVTDAHSRFILCCQAFDRINGHWVQKAYERLFREYGVPRAMRTDNGAPFASVGVAGLSRLGVWLVKVGVDLERIDPGRPDQNGRHERMHRTLKAETARPPRKSLRAQQLAFTRFRRVFNEERPHEALGQIRPARVYSPSLRPFPRKILGPTYPGHFETRKVQAVGQIHWRKKGLIFIGSALAGEHVGLTEYEDGLWKVSFGPVFLGVVDERDPKSRLIKPRRKRQRYAQLKDPTCQGGR